MKMIASKSLEALLVICTMVGTASAQKDHFYPPLEEDVFSPLDEEDPLVPGDDRGIGTQDSNTVLIVAASVPQTARRRLLRGSMRAAREARRSPRVLRLPGPAAAREVRQPALD